MTSNGAKLITVLSEKEDLMTGLVKLLEEERHLIVQMDVAGMEQLDERKRGLLVRLEDSTNSFRQSLRQAAAEHNLPEGATLSLLLPKVDSRERATLQGLQTRLIEIGAKLDKALVFNRELLQGSLGMVDRSLQFFQRLFKRSTTYGYGGGMVTAPSEVRLVCKEI